MCEEQSIYAIKNMVNGKMYIGRSNNPKRRFIEHKHIPPNEMLREDFKKYSKQSFYLCILENDMPTEIAKEREKYWILKLKTWMPDKGYNLRVGDENTKYLYDYYRKYHVRGWW